MSARPWFKFYPTDWRADSALRMCSLGARGLWLEMVCLMDESTPRGHLVVKGKSLQAPQLAILAGCTPQEIGKLLQELEDAEVFSRTADGTIFSRRMLRETKVSDDQRQKANQRWGSEETDLFNSGNADGNAETHAQKPESRVQKPESHRPVTRSRSATTIPEGFPDDEAYSAAREKCEAEGMAVNVVREGEKFRAHAESNDRKAKDWRAAFRQWIIHAIEWAPESAKIVQLADHLPDKEFTAHRYRTWMRDWIEKPYQWRHERGPQPDEPGCKIPPEIMAEFGHAPRQMIAP